MAEIIIEENLITEESGFDGIASPATAGHPNNPSMNKPGQAALHQFPVNAQNTAAHGSTNTADIAQQADVVRLAKNSISRSLPYMIGFVQPIAGPSAYVLGLTQKDQTKIAGQSNKANSGDPVVIRKFIQTDIREIKMDLTDETVQDITSMFPSYRGSPGVDGSSKNTEYYNTSEARKFFYQVGKQKITQKTNEDFVGFLEGVATIKGALTIKDYSEMEKIVGVLGELKESLFKATRKSGRYWALVSPRIANFLGTHYGTQFNDSDALSDGVVVPKESRYGYVTTLGDIAIYQSPMVAKKTALGGDSYIAEPTGEIFMGMTGNAGISSIYYYPYKEYIVKTGDDYQTGQSSVFFRIRDTWSLNPLDTLDGKQQTVDTPKANKNSAYVVKANITFDAAATLLN